MITNKDRQRAGKRAVKSHRTDTLSTESDWETQVIDCLADILHFAGSKGLAAEELARIAVNHYQEEVSIEADNKCRK